MSNNSAAHSRGGIAGNSAILSWW